MVEKIKSMVAMLLILVVIGVVTIGTIGLIVDYLFLDYMVVNDIVSSSAELWRFLIIMGEILMLPPLIMAGWAQISDSSKENTKNIAASSVMVLGEISGWLIVGFAIVAAVYILNSYVIM
jgi:uncharacterized membrane protein YraQ (UPF0718 family)